MFKPGDIVFFREAKRSSARTSPEIRLKGHGFAVFLGHIMPFAPDPAASQLTRIMGTAGYVSFDDVKKMYGEEFFADFVKKFDEKFYQDSAEKQAELPLEDRTKHMQQIPALGLNVRYICPKCKDKADLVITRADFAEGSKPYTCHACGYEDKIHIKTGAPPPTAVKAEASFVAAPVSFEKPSTLVGEDGKPLVH